MPDPKITAIFSIGIPTPVSSIENLVPLSLDFTESETLPEMGVNFTALDIIYSQFNNYIEQNDFVGADMARKFLQMGYTRARRYANYKGGKKYDKENDYEQLKRGTGDPEKAAVAAIFYEKWKDAEAQPIYAKLKPIPMAITSGFLQPLKST